MLLFFTISLNNESLFIRKYIYITYLSHSMNINELINYKITTLEKTKKIVFYALTGILFSILLILYLYSNNNYGILALILFISLIIILVTSIYLSLEYFKIVHEIEYNEFILEKLIDR